MPATTGLSRTRSRVTPNYPSKTPVSAVFDSDGNPHLEPAHNPPKYHIFDIFPLSLLVKALTKRGKMVKGKKAARVRARLQTDLLPGDIEGGVVSRNVPLEITLYLASYIASLQKRGLDASSINQLFAALNSLVDNLTGLERILTTPIPFSYSFHLWIVTWLYVLALPFQIVSVLNWVTIPATVLASFIFFGFIVAGEEIENPFGYDKNDLNLDHFCRNIIRLELHAMTSVPVPDPADWSGANALVPRTKQNWNLQTPPSRRKDSGGHIIEAEAAGHVETTAAGGGGHE